MARAKQEYNKDWYDQSREKWKAQFIKFKEATPCFDCGNFYPHYILQFDHVPERGVKKFPIAWRATTVGISSPSVKAELAKCDLVCANCHAARTWNRKQ